MTSLGRPGSTPIIGPRRARALLWWRVAFVGYVASLTIATHWPKLELGDPGLPSPDKMIHLYAFGGLVLMLRFTGWVRGFWSLIAAGTVWVSLDEWTQAIPVLEREFSIEDVIAGEAGVIASSMWCWALRPVGGRLSRARSGLQRCACDELFSMPLSIRGIVPWALIGLGFVPLGLSLLLVWPMVIDQLPNPTLAVGYGTVMALWLGLLLLLWRRVYMGAQAQVNDERRCPACSESCATATAGEFGVSNCPTCKAPTHLGFWLPPASPTTPTMRRMAMWPTIGAGSIVVGGVAAIYALAAFHSIASGTGLEWLGRAASSLTRLPLDYSITLDVAILLIASAVGVFLYRRRFAAWHDAQGKTCRTCSHDLRATPAPNGIGRCGECGGEFARWEDEDGQETGGTPVPPITPVPLLPGDES